MNLEARFSLDDYLLETIRLGASDLFLRADSHPSARVNGFLLRTKLPVPTESILKEYLDQILTPVAKETFLATGDIDMAYTIPGKGRFRINIFHHGGRLGYVIRHVPMSKLDFENLNLPDSLKIMLSAPQGLILVVGPTGCGKSTTLAAMIQHINQNRRGHIITIEDPVEFIHEENLCLIHHRQVGFDTKSFASALKHVVRQNPDVILVGEMRDNDTVQTALSASLTGHLILSTLHTSNAVQAIERIMNYFPPEARDQARSDIASTLVGVVSMRLLPVTDGSSRVPVLEILVGTSTVRRIILEGNLKELYDVMKRSNDQGMCTFNQSLVALCKDKRIHYETALRVSPNPEEFKLNMAGMFTGIDSIDIRSDIRTKHKKDI